MHAMSLDYYVLEMEDVNGPLRLEIEFGPGYFQFIIAEGYDRYIYRAVDLTPENVFLLVYIFGKYIERVLGEDEIRELLK